MRVLSTSCLTLALLYLALLGGTWAVISSYEVRLASQLLLMAALGVPLVILSIKDYRFTPTDLDTPIVAFLAVALLSATFSINPRLSFESVLLLAGYIVLFKILIVYARTHSAIILKVLTSVAVVVSLAAFSELVLWYFGLAPQLGYFIGWLQVAPPGQLIPPVWARPTFVSGNPNILAGYLAPLPPLGIAIALDASTRHRKVAAGLWTGVIVSAVLSASSRGGFLALTVGIVSYLGLRWSFNHRTRITALMRESRYLALLTIGAILASITYLGFGLVNGRLQGSAGTRVILWDHAFAMFRERPILGVGPDAFGLALLRQDPTISQTGDFLPHAHNLYLGIAADTGLLGIAAVAWIAVRLLRYCVRSWKAANSKQRSMLMAFCSGLTAMAAHGLVEDFRAFPLLLLHGLTFAVLILTVAVPPPLKPATRPRLSARMLLGATALLLPFTVFTTYSRSQLNAGVELADAGKWREAYSQLTRLNDLDPGLAFHELQASLSLAQLSQLADPSSLETATVALTDAIEEEPYYALNHANLATLLWSQNKPAEAIDRMTRAMEMHPAEPRYRLNLAHYRIAEDEFGSAQALLVTLLSESPEICRGREWEGLMREWEDKGGGSRAALMAKTADQIDSRQIPPFDKTLALGALELNCGSPALAAQHFAALAPNNESADALEGLGRALLAAGRTLEARSLISRTIALAPTRASTHAAFAEVLFQLDEIKDAEREARMAVFLDRNREAHLVLARILRAQELTNEAFVHYRAALPSKSSYVAYALTAWHRRGTLHDTLPSLRDVRMRSQDSLVYREYAQYLVSQDRLGDAEEVYNQLLHYGI